MIFGTPASIVYDSADPQPFVLSSNHKWAGGAQGTGGGTVTWSFATVNNLGIETIEGFIDRIKLE